MSIYQVAQHAVDLDRAEAFYEEFLGKPASGRFDPPGLLFFETGDMRLLLEVNAPPALIYFKVDDVADKVEDLRAKGVTVESEPHVIFRHADNALGPAGTDEWHAFIRDSEGNLLGLIEHKASDISPAPE